MRSFPGLCQILLARKGKECLISRWKVHLSEGWVLVGISTQSFKDYESEKYSPFDDQTWMPFWIRIGTMIKNMAQASLAGLLVPEIQTKRTGLQVHNTSIGRKGIPCRREPFLRNSTSNHGLGEINLYRYLGKITFSMYNLIIWRICARKEDDSLLNRSIRKNHPTVEQPRKAGTASMRKL